MGSLQQIQDLPRQWANLAELQMEEYWQRLQQLAARLKDPVNASYRSGVNKLARGKYPEARASLKFFLWRRPAHARAHYYLALSYFGMNQKFEALKVLNRSIQLDDKDEEALYLKASYEGGKYADGVMPHTTPKGFLTTHFAKSPLTYDAREIENGYQGHSIIFHRVIDDILPKTRLSSVLDIGCGTGSCGALMRPLCNALVGVDLSPDMLAVASIEEPPFYTRLHEKDCRDFILQSPENEFDLVIAAHLLPWVGGLKAVMDGAHRVLKPGGYFIFTCYQSKKPQDYEFIPGNNLFAHSEHYLSRTIEQSGLKTIKQEAVSLYTEAEEPAPSLCIIVQKS